MFWPAVSRRLQTSPPFWRSSPQAFRGKKAENRKQVGKRACAFDIVQGGHAVFHVLSIDAPRQACACPVYPKGRECRPGNRLFARAQNCNRIKTAKQQMGIGAPWVYDRLRRITGYRENPSNALKTPCFQGVSLNKSKLREVQYEDRYNMRKHEI